MKNLFKRFDRRRASILILVLWMLILLGVVGLSFSSSVCTQIHAFRARRGRIEAYWAARAGVEQAMAVAAQTDLRRLIDTDPLFDDAELFAEQQIGPAQFSLIASAGEADSEPRFGLIDEAARLNINTAEADVLGRLPGITEPMVHCLVDWRDRDDEPEASGAEIEVYESLDEPYPVRNGPLASVRELMRVRHWPGVFRLADPDPYERYATTPPELPPIEPAVARQLLDMLTTWSIQSTVAPDDRAKLNLNDDSEDELKRRISGLTDEEARAIVAHRESNQFNSPLDLLDVRQPAEDNNQANGGDQQNNQSGNSNGRPQNGNQSDQRPQQNDNQSDEERPKVFTLKRVGAIIDYCTTQSDDASMSGLGSTQTAMQPGGVNINTASYDVLMLLEGMTDHIAQEIIRERRTRAGIETAGSIVEIDSVDEETFRKLYPVITTSIRRLRVVSRGWEPDSDAVASIEAILSIENQNVQIVYWREF